MNKVIKSVASVCILSSFMTIAQASDDKDNEQEYKVIFQSLNGSGVYGEAEIEIEKGNKLKIEIEANGLEFGKPHPQHIHGKDTPVSNATCPDISADVDADGLISVGEGLPFYGPIVLPLTPFNTVNENGELRYEASFTINPGSVQPLHKRTIVLHGMTVNGAYIPSLPIACGQISIDND